MKGYSHWNVLYGTSWHERIPSLERLVRHQTPVAGMPYQSVPFLVYVVRTILSMHVERLAVRHQLLAFLTCGSFRLSDMARKLNMEMKVLDAHIR